MANTYLLYCESQPLPLFHRTNFVETVKYRDPEVLFALLALTARYLEHEIFHQNPMDLVDGYQEAALNIVSRKIFEGRVELSTLQSLCLLSLVDFASKNPLIYWEG